MSVRSQELAREKRDLDTKLPTSFNERFRRSEMQYDPSTNETKYIITLSNDQPEERKDGLPDPRRESSQERQEESKDDPGTP